MNAPRPSFDLLREPWIPCVDSHGTSVELGLIETLLRAHELRAISDPSPLCTFALHRFLLAVVHRIVDGPRTTADWKALWKAGRLDEGRVMEYLEKWSERFDLFHSEWPFYQTARFTILKNGSDSPAPVTRLLPEITSGNNATLFDHSTDESCLGLSDPQVARALLVAQAWGLGGGNGPTSNLFGHHPNMSHAPCVGAIAVLIDGQTLFRTLTLNLARIGPEEPPPFCSGVEDLPSWERCLPHPPGARVPTGYLEFITWQSRHLRLKPEAEGVHVKEVFVAQGPHVDEKAEFENPFAFYRVSKKNGLQAVRLVPERAVWRDSGALFASRGDTSSRPSVLRFCTQRQIRRLIGEDSLMRVVCFGLANDKAKPLTWRREEIPAPIRILDDPDLIAELEAGIEVIESTYLALSESLRRLASALLATETKKPDAKDVSRLRTRLLRHAGFWEGVEPGFHRFLHDLGSEGRRKWLEQAVSVAREGLRRAAGAIGGTPARRWQALAIAERELAKRLPKVPEPTLSPNAASMEGTQ